MESYQAIGYLLNQSTAITTIVSGRIFHGLRPATSTLPCINYYTIAGGNKKYGAITEPFSINCRASTPNGSRDLAKEVVTLFAGDDYQGTYGTASSMSIARIAYKQESGLLAEYEDGVYNTSIDIIITY